MQILMILMILMDFTNIDKSMPAAEFQLIVKLYYVTDTDLEEKSSIRTWT